MALLETALYETGFSVRAATVPETILRKLVRDGLAAKAPP